MQLSVNAEHSTVSHGYAGRVSDGQRGFLPSEIYTSGSTHAQACLGRESMIWKLPCLESYSSVFKAVVCLH